MRFTGVTKKYVICNRHGVTSGTIEVGCDSQEGLRHTFGVGPSFDADIKDADYDLLSAIRQLLASSPIKWTSHHVAGHQDDDGIEVLDRWAKLNIEMDSLVKVYWNDMVDQHQAVNSPIEHEYWPVYISGRKISS